MFVLQNTIQDNANFSSIYSKIISYSYIKLVKFILSNFRRCKKVALVNLFTWSDKVFYYNYYEYIFIIMIVYWTKTKKKMLKYVSVQGPGYTKRPLGTLCHRVAKTTLSGNSTCISLQI